MNQKTRTSRDRTRPSLLHRVRDRRDQEAWRRFHERYAPLLYGYARARGLPHADAEDVRDQCMDVLLRRLPEFEYDRSKGRFKSWLFRIVHAKVVDLIRMRPLVQPKTGELEGVVDASDPIELWHRHVRHRELLDAVHDVRGHVSRRNWSIFERLLFRDRSVPEICEELGVTPNQVYKAKVRVLAEVRTRLDRAADEDL